MIYKSNLTAPNIAQHFRNLHSRVQGHSLGHDVPSDWKDKGDDDPAYGIYKRCGMWTHDEAAILYRIAESVGKPTEIGLWLDIGAHTGWTSAHLSAAGNNVISVEPMLWRHEWYERFADNVGVEMKHGYIMAWAGRSRQFFEVIEDTALMFDGIVIDGDHDDVEADVHKAMLYRKSHGVILMHDFIGAWNRAGELLERGYRCRVYMTPHVIGCFWRGDWTPPEHTPDPAIDWQEIRTNHMRGFDWSKTE